MGHVNTEVLLEFLEIRGGQSPTEQKKAIENHLAKCNECVELKRELQSLVLRLQEDASFEPPAELVDWGVNLFQPMLQPSTGGRVRKLIAALVFDTFDQPIPAGVRLIAAPSRQLLFRAGDVDVDVKIESKEANACINLVGQVLSTTPKFFDNIPVRLESHGIVRYRTITNLVGEFSFDEVPKDTYHLSVDLPEGQVTLFCVHRSNS